MSLPIEINADVLTDGGAFIRTKIAFDPSSAAVRAYRGAKIHRAHQSANGVQGSTYCGVRAGKYFVVDAPELSKYAEPCVKCWGAMGGAK